MVNSMVRTGTAVALVGLILALGGCREEEMGRPLAYEKGTYRGPADEPLPPNVVEQLRQRMDGQRAGGL